VHNIELAQNGGNGRCVAQWFRERNVLVITDMAGNMVGSYPVPGESDSPGPEILWRNGWLTYPGTEWEEEPPGHWSCAVFPESALGSK
jgi:hypothetical protein